MNTLEFINIPPQTGEAKGLIVVMHGWGANAQDVESLLPFVNLPDYHFVFPNAPFPYPYSPMGRAWYDLSRENLYQGLPESRQQLLDWLQSLEGSTGIPLSRTLLSGFSQGGAMTLDVGFKLPFAALVVMSGYLHPGAATITNGIETLPPVLIVHGQQDEVVPLGAAQKARTTLESSAVPVQYLEFAGGHEISPQVLEVFRNFAISTFTE